MGTELVHTLQFQLQDVRVVIENGQPLFVEADLLKVLSLTKNRMKFRAGEKGRTSIHTLGGPQLMNVLSETAVYRLIMRSDKAEAVEFQYWVADHLANYRRTGTWTNDDQPVAMSELVPAMNALLPAINGMVQTMQLMVGMTQQTNARLDSDAILLADHDTRLKRIESLQTSGSGYVTLMGYGRLRNIPLSVSEARTWAQKAKVKAKDLGMKLGTVPDERWGSVRSYPVELLDELFGDMKIMEDFLRRDSL